MASIYRRSATLFVPAALLVTLAVALAALLAMDAFYGDLMRESLEPTVRALALQAPAEARTWFAAPGAAAEAWVRGLDEGSGLRVTLMRPDGLVVADSRAEPATMENHGHRPEMRAALEGRTGMARRTSATLGRELFYAARGLTDPSGRILGVLRVAVDLPSLRARLAPARDILIGAILLIGLGAAAAAAFFARSVAAPLSRLSEAALAVGDSRRAGRGGALEARQEIRLAALASGPDEVRVLAGALDAMVRELEGRNRAELLEGRERSAILEGMSEAVLGLDGGLRLRTANRAARLLFELEEGGGTRGLPLAELTRSTELVDFATACREGGEPLERELALYGRGGERWFRVLVAPFGGLEASGGEGGGLVLVLDDQTRLRRLERVRRDFVANVSHELRTPVQLIKGFAETLREEGFDDTGRSLRFLGIIERNAVRMENLIADLLSLARLEQEGGGGLETSEEDIGSLVEEALVAVRPKAEAKGSPLAAEVEEGLRARVQGGLVVQALVNLLDNAVKYAPAGGPIRVSARLEGTAPEQAGEGSSAPAAGLEGRPGKVTPRALACPSLLLEVRDRGPGIPARDLPRLFERFYTVDRARSRELGGTGLGLAIVRHIALAHGGEAGAESWEGEGSRFWLRLPQPEASPLPSGKSAI